MGYEEGNMQIHSSLDFVVLAQQAYESKTLSAGHILHY